MTGIWRIAGHHRSSTSVIVSTTPHDWNRAVRKPVGLPLVLAAVGLLGLAACTAEPDPVEDATSAAEEAGVDLPDELASAVTAVAPDVDAEDILSNAENVCQEIESGKDAETLAGNAAARFEVDVSLGPDLVAAIEPHCETIR